MGATIQQQVENAAKIANKSAQVARLKRENENKLRLIKEASAQNEAELLPRLTHQQIIEARRKFKAQVVSFDATQELGTEFPYSDLVRLKVTNNSDVVLKTLTVLIKRYNNAGNMIGSSRTPVSVGDLKSKQSAEVDIYPRGHLPYVKNITVEIEALVSKDHEQFFNELHDAVSPAPETENNKQGIEYPVIDPNSISFDTSESMLTNKFPKAVCEQMPNPAVRMCRVPISELKSISFLYYSGELININGRKKN